MSTEDHQELMNAIAAKTGAQLSLIPSIPDVHSSTKHDQSKDMVSDGQQDLLEINSYGEIMGNLSVSLYGYIFSHLRCLELINSIFLCSVHVIFKARTLLLSCTPAAQQGNQKELCTHTMES